MGLYPPLAVDLANTALHARSPRSEAEWEWVQVSTAVPLDFARSAQQEHDGQRLAAPESEFQFAL